MIDIVREIEAIEREVGSGRIPAGEARTLRRTYDARIDDVWDALTTPDRISRWFLPVSGDSVSAGATSSRARRAASIVACDRPNRLQVTWVYPPSDDAGASEVGSG